MKKILIIFLFALILIPSSAVAELGFTDGNKILSSCNELIKIIDSQLELDSFEAGIFIR